MIEGLDHCDAKPFLVESAAHVVKVRDRDIDTRALRLHGGSCPSGSSVIVRVVNDL